MSKLSQKEGPIWDAYAAAALSAYLSNNISSKDAVKYASDAADELLKLRTERRKLNSDYAAGNS